MKEEAQAQRGREEEDLRKGEGEGEEKGKSGGKGGNKSGEKEKGDQTALAGASKEGGEVPNSSSKREKGKGDGGGVSDEGASRDEKRKAGTGQTASTGVSEPGQAEATSSSSKKRKKRDPNGLRVGSGSESEGAFRRAEFVDYFVLNTLKEGGRAGGYPDEKLAKEILTAQHYGNNVFNQAKDATPEQEGKALRERPEDPFDWIEGDFGAATVHRRYKPCSDCGPRCSLRYCACDCCLCTLRQGNCSCFEDETTDHAAGLRRAPKAKQPAGPPPAKNKTADDERAKERGGNDEEGGHEEDQDGEGSHSWRRPGGGCGTDNEERRSSASEGRRWRNRRGDDDGEWREEEAGWGWEEEGGGADDEYDEHDEQDWEEDDDGEWEEGGEPERKNAICKFWAGKSPKGKCKRGKFCRFAHGGWQIEQEVLRRGDDWGSGKGGGGSSSSSSSWQQWN